MSDWGENWAEDTYSRLLGLRVAARIHPDVSEPVTDRMVTIISNLSLQERGHLLLTVINSACMMYEERDPDTARKQADNIARALRGARDLGGAA